MTTKWPLVVAVCFFMPLTGALATLKAADVRFTGYALAMALGAAIGFARAWALQIAGAAVGNQMRRQSGPDQPRYALALNVGAVMWIGIALFLGIRFASMALRLLA